MTKFCITYLAAGWAKRAIAIELASPDVSLRTVATAIINREFPDVTAPFGPFETLTAVQVLRRFAISEVRMFVVSDEQRDEPAQPGQ